MMSHPLGVQNAIGTELKIELDFRFPEKKQDYYFLKFFPAEKLVDGRGDEPTTLCCARPHPVHQTLAAPVPCLTCFLVLAPLRYVVVPLKFSSNTPRS